MKKAILFILISTLSAMSAYALNEGDISSPIEISTNQTNESTSAVSIKDFSNLSLTYATWFDRDFPTGFYGIRYESFLTNGGFMATLAFKGSWGITNPGYFEFRWGFGKGWAINENIALVIPANFVIGDYISDIRIDDNLNLLYSKSLWYGVIASPGIRIKIDRFLIGASFDLGVQFADGIKATVGSNSDNISADTGHLTEFYKGFEISAGFTF